MKMKGNQHQCWWHLTPWSEGDFCIIRATQAGDSSQGKSVPSNKIPPEACGTPSRHWGDRTLDTPPGKRCVLQAGEDVRTVPRATEYQPIRDGLPPGLINAEHDKMDSKTLKTHMTSQFCWFACLHSKILLKVPTVCQELGRPKLIR